MPKVINEKVSKALKLYKQGLKLIEIAEKLNVPNGTIRRWKSTYNWEEKVVKKNDANVRNKSNENKTNVRNKGGAPKGNKNAVGKTDGAPVGNTNAEKHGAYSAVKWDALDETELYMYNNMPTDEETLLVDEIFLFDIRERHILAAIKKYTNTPKGLTISSVNRSEWKIEFETEEKKERYEQLKSEKAHSEDISELGHKYHISTSTEATINIVQRLENELTRVQRAKTQAISELNKIRSGKEKPVNHDQAIKDWLQVSSMHSGNIQDLFDNADILEPLENTENEDDDV